MANKIKNILFSATRQWNPGDEFILFGCENIIRSLGVEFNSVLFNRNPEVRPLKAYLNPFRKNVKSKFLSSEKLNAFLRLGFKDNSFKDDTDPSFIDYAVFAGSPEFDSPRLKSMYLAIKEKNIPCAFLGIGSKPSSKDKDVLSVIQNAAVFTVRAPSLLSPAAPGAVYMPCPALFSTGVSCEKEVKEVKKIALAFAVSSDMTPASNGINPKIYVYQSEFFNAVINKFKTAQVCIVCHYIDELPYAHKLFGGRQIFYSYDAAAYKEIYKQFDLVISPRVHAVGMCASLGIPGMVIAHDWRGETADGFLGEKISLDTPAEDALKAVEKLAARAAQKSLNLAAHKRETLLKYQNLLGPFFKK
ncbi:MAG: polysaccharide pyruvyl transferase family protein [Elusimicrobium sp.]|jgi:hypothetical protein|nr:polysaccharide pyruvyl transferase family protein [Elusimicrobium sp.]